MDIGTLTNAPRTLSIGGLSYKVRALTFAELGVIQNWLRDNADDPVTEALRQISKAHAKGVAVAPETEAVLLTQARQDAARWPPMVLSSAWFNLLGRAPGGTVQFLLAMLRPCQPSIAEEQVAEIERNLTEEEGDAIILAAAGREMPPKSGPPAGGAEEGAKPRASRRRTTGASRSSGSSRPA